MKKASIADADKQLSCVRLVCRNGGHVPIETINEFAGNVGAIV